MGGSFPHLWISSIDVNQREKIQKRKKRERKTDREREEEKWASTFSLRSAEIRFGDFRQGKKQSLSTRREFRLGTRIWDFRQTLRGKEFSYFDYF